MVGNGLVPLHPQVFTSVRKFFFSLHAGQVRILNAIWVFPFELLLEPRRVSAEDSDDYARDKEFDIGATVLRLDALDLRVARFRLVD